MDLHGRTTSSAASAEAIDGRLSVNNTEQRIHLNAADRTLATQFGYKPVFQRQFGFLSTFSFAVSISGLFSTVTTTFVFPLYAGGSASAVWCWLISGAGCMCIAASVAEIVSAYPTCGGLYYSVSRLAPKRWVPSISWLVGWTNLLGQLTGLASSEYGAAQILLAAVSMGRDFDWYPTTGTTVGVMAALTVLSGIVNSLPTSWIERLTKTYVIAHFSLLLACAIALLVKTEHKHNASYVFTNVDAESGWTPGFSFLLGFLSVSWTMTGYDSTAHISEEIKDPAILAPRAIFLAMSCTYILGWLFTIVLCLCMGDIDSILASPIEQPVAQIYYNSLGKGGGIFFTIAAFLVLQFVCFTATQALGRSVFAFSRDRLLPFSTTWIQINKRTNTPLCAVWICIFWIIAINLIALGSYTAISGVFNVCAIAFDWSYCIPIACKLIFGKFEPGPWSMGQPMVSKLVNAWACLWTLFVSIIFIFPDYRPVTSANMNYAIAYVALIAVASTSLWYAGGRKYYTGPLVEVDAQEVVDVGGGEFQLTQGCEEQVGQGDKHSVRQSVEIS